MELPRQRAWGDNRAVSLSSEFERFTQARVAHRVRRMGGGCRCVRARAWTIKVLTLLRHKILNEDGSVSHGGSNPSKRDTPRDTDVPEYELVRSNS